MEVRAPEMGVFREMPDGSIVQATHVPPRRDGGHDKPWHGPEPKPIETPRMARLTKGPSFLDEIEQQNEVDPRNSVQNKGLFRSGWDAATRSYAWLSEACTSVYGGMSQVGRTVYAPCYIATQAVRTQAFEEEEVFHH